MWGTRAQGCSRGAPGWTPAAGWAGGETEAAQGPEGKLSRNSRAHTAAGCLRVSGDLELSGI